MELYTLGEEMFRQSQYSKTLFYLLVYVLAAVLSGFTPFAMATGPIGIIAIAVETHGQSKNEFSINDPVHQGDHIITSSKGTTTILFNDESILTLGPNSHAKIEIYTEGTATTPGRSHIEMTQGNFRFIPGTILEQGGAQFISAGNKIIGQSYSGWYPAATQQGRLPIPTRPVSGNKPVYTYSGAVTKGDIRLFILDENEQVVANHETLPGLPATGAGGQPDSISGGPKFEPPGQPDTFEPPGQPDTFEPPGKPDTFEPPGKPDFDNNPGKGRGRGG